MDCFVQIDIIIKMTNTNIPNAIVGGILVSLSHTLFQWIHSRPLKLSEVFWTLTVLQPKFLPQYLPVVSGIFFTSGLLFDCLNYEGAGSFNPYGPKDAILLRTSMYGFALGGFAIGLGSQLAKGDEIYHSLIQIAQGHWVSLLVLTVMLTSAFLWSWLASQSHLAFLSNQSVNPEMELFHYLSANITIAIAIVLIIVAVCLYRSKLTDPKVIAQKIGGSFCTGLLISLGFGLCGLPTRTIFLAGITPDQNWSPQFIVFLCTGIVLSAISTQILNSTPLPKDIALRDSQEMQPMATTEVKLFSKRKRCIGALLYGMGWGVTGLDIATFLIHSSLFTIPIVIIFGGFFIMGSMIGDAL